MDISPVIIVKNAARTIAQTLESLKEFDEVVVYDTGSDDETMNIARLYENVKLCKGKFSGFGKSKNKAALLAKNNWIFSIDADEVVSPQLINSIKKLQLDKPCVYRIKRYNYYRKRRIRYSGWGKEYVIRIYNKSQICFNEKMVHEHIEVDDSKIITLNGELRHFSYHSISDFIRKRDLYSELFAIENEGRRKSSPFMAFIRGTFDFLNTFIVKRGYRDGYRGLLIAVSNANVSFFKYLKLYEANIHNSKKISLIITTYNRKEALELTLTSVLAQTIPPDEIIIADDGSQNDTREMIEYFAKRSFIPIIHSWQEDIGFRAAKSRNKAISKSSGDYIIFIDGDIILHRNFIIDHIRASEKGYYVQGSRVLLDSALSQKFIDKETTRLPFLFSKRFRNKLNSIYIPFLSRLFFHYEKKSHNGVRSCNFSFFKEDLIKVNGFNEDFEGWGREDSELIERLYNIGLRRKNLKFCGIQYHLNHHIGKASSNNEEILKKSVLAKSKWCENGIDKHLEKFNIQKEVG
jgi:glycosyltransferase involved in cell wall biosynthesis